MPLPDGLYQAGTWKPASVCKALMRPFPQRASPVSHVLRASLGHRASTVACLRSRPRHWRVQPPHHLHRGAPPPPPPPPSHACQPPKYFSRLAGLQPWNCTAHAGSLKDTHVRCFRGDELRPLHHELDSISLCYQGRLCARRRSSTLRAGRSVWRVITWECSWPCRRSSGCMPLPVPMGSYQINCLHLQIY